MLILEYQTRSIELWSLSLQPDFKTSVCMLLCVLSIRVLPIQLGIELFHCARALGTVKHSIALDPSRT